jgi:hypothetical protein
MSRDVARAYNILSGNFNNWLGPEIGNSYVRLPGPFFNLLLSFFLVFKSLNFLIIAKGLLLIATLVLLLRETLRVQKKERNYIWWILLFSNPLIIISARNLWNPSLIMTFTALSLYFYFKSFRTQYRLVDYIVLALIPFLSVQVHMSTLLPHFMVLFVLMIKARGREKLYLLSTLAPLICLLVYWKFGVDQQGVFEKQVSETYATREFTFGWIMTRLNQLTYHLSLQTTRLDDYDLFYMLKGRMQVLLPNLNLVFSFFETFFTYAWKLIIICCIALSPIAFKRFRIRRGINFYTLILVILWMSFVAISMTIYSDKDNIPYRYGQMLYPAQFLFVSLMCGFIYNEYIFKIKLKRLLFVTRSFVIGNVLFNFVYIVAFLFVMNSTGLSYHGSDQSFELNLHEKKQIISSLPYNETLTRRDYSFIHGRIINRMRLHEHDWNYNFYWGGIDKSVSINHSNLNNRLYFYNFETNQIEIRKLSPQMIPIRVSSYHFSDNNLELSVENGDIEFMPRVGLVDSNIKKLVVKVRFDISVNSFCIDYDGSPPINLYKFKKIIYNNDVLKSYKSYNGGWLVLNKECFKFEDTPDKEKEIEIFFDVIRADIGKFARIDIYGVPLDILENDNFFF